MPFRASRVPKRKNNSTDVTNTNLAHTARLCLPESLRAMAERYHKTPSQNSTPVPDPLWQLPPAASDCIPHATSPSKCKLCRLV